MKQYLDLLKDVLENGSVKSDRTGTGTISKFGGQMRFDLSEGFPLVTTKKTHMKSIIHELLWFIKGDTNATYLQENGVKIWNEWALKEDETTSIDLTPPERLALAVKDGLLDMPVNEFKLKYAKDNELELGMNHLDTLNVPRTKEWVVRKKGDLGPIYGKQWRNWKDHNGEYHDQLANAIKLIKTDPDSRRIIVSAWNVGELADMHLCPCHAFFQFYVSDGKLSCHLYQRSVDTFLGLPFNIASYALLTHMVAQVCDLEVGEFIWSGGDIHIYSNHVDQVKLQLTREPMKLSKLILNPLVKDIDSFKYEDIVVTEYESYPAIKAPISV